MEIEANEVSVEELSEVPLISQEECLGKAIVFSDLERVGGSVTYYMDPREPILDEDMRMCLFRFYHALHYLYPRNHREEKPPFLAFRCRLLVLFYLFIYFCVLICN